jgi:uncharacterized membrane protein YdjX (TVP38/TMEM64 family)
MEQEQAVQMDDAGSARHGSRPWVRPLLLGLAVVAAMVAARALGLGDRLGELRVWIEGLGFWGPVVFAAIYAIATVAAIPGSVITVAAGAMFGSVTGIVVVSLGSTLGATGAFVLGRWFARDSVTRWLEGNEKFNRLDRLTRDHGAIIVAITRLVPLFPFNLLNYGFGLTRVPLGTYVFWSWLCMLPGTVLYVVGADAVARGLAEGRVPWTLVGVLVATVVALTLIVARARRVLAEREAGAETEGSS